MAHPQGRGPAPRLLAFEQIAERFASHGPRIVEVAREMRPKLRTLCADVSSTRFDRFRVELDDLLFALLDEHGRTRAVIEASLAWEAERYVLAVDAVTSSPELPERD